MLVFSWFLCHKTTAIFSLIAHLFKVPLHGLVSQQQHRPHQISHQDEISFGFQVKGHNIVIVVTFSPQLLLSCPLVQTHLKQRDISNCLSSYRQQKLKDK